MFSLKEWSFERCIIALFGNYAQNNGELKSNARRMKRLKKTE